MPMLPAAPVRPGNFRGFRAVGTSFAIGALSLAVANTAIAAESTADILKKMTDVYNKAKSYQVTITTLQTGKTPQGKPFSVTQTEHIQYQSPNMFHKSVKITGTGAAVSGAGAQQLAMRQGEIYSDGKTATMYVPARKIYQKQAVPPTVQLAQIVDLLRLVPSAVRPGLTLLPTTASVKGHPAYVLELKPVVPKNLKPDQLKKYNEGLKQFKQYPRFMIDKQNFNLLEYSMATVAGNAQVDLTSQVFGGQISPGSFAFNPPAGAKEYHAPPQGVPGGPGAPGGPPPGVVPGGAPGGAPRIPGKSK